MEEEEELEYNYWQKRLSRRNVLRYTGVAGLGIAGASLIACGEDSTPTVAPTASATATAPGTATATATVPGTTTATATPTASTPTPTPTVDANKPIRGGTPNVLQPTGIDHLNPATNTYPAGFIFSLAYGQLFKWKNPPAEDPGALENEPYMAASIEQPDPLTAIIKLREGIKYHNVDPVNGRAMDPGDIAATWAYIKDEKTGSTRIKQQEPVHIPETVDALTAKFTLDFPYAPFFNYIADVWQSIVAKEAIEKGGDWLQQNLIGTGPYQLIKNDLGVESVLTAVPTPWWTPWDPSEPAPYFDGIRMPHILDDLAKQAIAFLGGQLDYGTVSQADWDTVQKDPRFGSDLITSQDFNYIRINHPLKPMDDVRVRQALSVGIDRQAAVDTAFSGIGAVPTGPVPTARTPWGQLPDDTPFHTYDPAQAKMLLTAAGFPDGLELINEYPAQDNQQTDYVKAFTAQLLQSGITIKQDSNEYGAYLEKCRLAKTDPEGAGWHINMHWGNRYNDISGYLAEYRTDGGRNYGHWGDPATDALIKAADQIVDIKDRVEAVHAINQTIATMAWTPGTTLPVYMNTWTSKITNFADSPEWYTGSRNFLDSWFKADA